MSALAQWLKAKGKQVAGYDKTRTSLCQKLENQGIDIHYQDSTDLIPPEFLDKNTTLVVYTPAVPQQHSELVFFKDNGFTVVKRAELLGWVSRDKFTIAVAGTHGKTTTSTLLAHLLKSSGLNVTAFLGGISVNYQSNLLLAQGDGQEIVVVEADEFDRSFLQLSPNMAIVTSTDADHLDIYQSADQLLDAYHKFAGLVKPNHLFVNEKTNLDKTNCLIYGFQNAQFQIIELSYQEYNFNFSIRTSDKVLGGLQLGMPGFHNVENCTAAVAVALRLGLSEEAIRLGVSTFKGIKRRFEFVYKGSDVVYIDDYAHHPSEIEAFITSMRAVFPQRVLTVVFQPHLFTRTRDFMDGFAKSLSLADRVILLEIYPARELPIEGVDSQALLQKIPLEHKYLVSDADLVEFLMKMELDVLATVGAGDIDRFVPLIAKSLENR